MPSEAAIWITLPCAEGFVPFLGYFRLEDHSLAGLAVHHDAQRLGELQVADAALFFYGGLSLLLSLVLPARRTAAMAAGVILLASYFFTTLTGKPVICFRSEYDPERHHHPGASSSIIESMDFGAGFAWFDQYAAVQAASPGGLAVSGRRRLRE